VIVLFIYLAGLPLGFFLAAVKKDKWWKTNSGPYEWGGELPVIITLLWFLVVPLFFLCRVLVACYEKIMKLIDGFLNLQVKTANYIQKRKERKPARHKRIVVPVATETKPGGYRDQAPKPCIACGVPTSIDQSGMECVESAEAQYNRLDI